MNMTKKDKQWVKAQILSLNGLVIMLFSVSLAAVSATSKAVIMPVWGIIFFLVLGLFGFLAGSVKEAKLDQESKRVPNKQKGGQVGQQ